MFHGSIFLGATRMVTYFSLVNWAIYMEKKVGGLGFRKLEILKPLLGKGC